MMGILGSLVTLDAGMLSLEEIAFGLSKAPRFVGQTVVPWVVADHLIAGMVYAERAGWAPALRLHFGLHDASEAVTGDVPTGFKPASFKALQQRLDVRLYAKLGLALPTLAEADTVHRLDGDMLLAEAATVAPPATYRRIVAERAHREADHEHRVAVQEVLSWQYGREDTANAWLDRVLPLILQLQGR